MFKKRNVFVSFLFKKTFTFVAFATVVDYIFMIV